jgi:hypothetical protein
MDAAGLERSAAVDLEPESGRDGAFRRQRQLHRAHQSAAGAEHDRYMAASELMGQGFPILH